jgi:GNAT superfamily N-acetyltransferase
LSDETPYVYGDEMIYYRRGTIPTALALKELFRGQDYEFPFDSEGSIATMFLGADLIITAWDGNQLVGIARALTDFVRCCYLADLVVAIGYQHQGIGRRMIQIVREQVTKGCSIMVFSEPSAMTYYPKVGFKPAVNAFFASKQDDSN